MDLDRPRNAKSSASADLTPHHPHLHSGGGVFSSGFSPLLCHEIIVTARSTPPIANDHATGLLPGRADNHPGSAEPANESRFAARSAVMLRRCLLVAFCPLLSDAFHVTP